MKTFTWRALSVVGVLVALAFFPRVSSATDCSFNGAISPPLTDDSGECIASGAIKASGVLEVDSTSTDEFDIEGGMTLRIRRIKPNPGPVLEPGSLQIDSDGEIDGECPFGGGEDSSLSQPVVIDAADEIHSDGILTICNTRQGVRLRAANGDVTLHGTDTFLEGSQVKLESGKGNITLADVTVISDVGTVDVVAPRGTITVSDSTFTANGGKGTCRFTGAFVDGGGNTFNCTVVTH